MFIHILAGNHTTETTLKFIFILHVAGIYFGIQENKSVHFYFSFCYYFCCCLLFHPTYVKSEMKMVI